MMDKSESIATVDDAIKKLVLLDSKDKIWTQEMLLQVTDKAVRLLDCDTQVLLLKPSHSSSSASSPSSAFFSFYLFVSLSPSLLFSSLLVSISVLLFPLSSHLFYSDFILSSPFLHLFSSLLLSLRFYFSLSLLFLFSLLLFSIFYFSLSSLLLFFLLCSRSVASRLLCIVGVVLRVIKKSNRH